MSDALLELFQKMIDHDQGYRQRLERHDKMGLFRVSCG